MKMPTFKALKGIALTILALVVAAFATAQYDVPLEDCYDHSVLYGEWGATCDDEPVELCSTYYNQASGLFKCCANEVTTFYANSEGEFFPGACTSSATYVCGTLNIYTEMTPAKCSGPYNIGGVCVGWTPPGGGGLMESAQFYPSN